MRRYRFSTCRFHPLLMSDSPRPWIAGREHHLCVYLMFLEPLQILVMFILKDYILSKPSYLFANVITLNAVIAPWKLLLETLGEDAVENLSEEKCKNDRVFCIKMDWNSLHLPQSSFHFTTSPAYISIMSSSWVILPLFLSDVWTQCGFFFYGPFSLRAVCVNCFSDTPLTARTSISHSVCQLLLHSQPECHLIGLVTICEHRLTL